MFACARENSQRRNSVISRLSAYTRSRKRKRYVYFLQTLLHVVLYFKELTFQKIYMTGYGIFQHISSDVYTLTFLEQALVYIVVQRFFGFSLTFCAYLRIYIYYDSFTLVVELNHLNAWDFGMKSRTTFLRFYTVDGAFYLWNISTLCKFIKRSDFYFLHNTIINVANSVYVSVT